MIASSLPPEADTMLRSELNSGEKLVWTGQPIAGRTGWSALPIFLFGIPWTAFSIFWIVMAGGITSHAAAGPSAFPVDGMANVFPLFGIPFVLIGFGMLTSPLWMAKKAQGTVYALTDKRAFILTPGWGNGVSVRSIPPADLIDRTRNQQPDGSGSLIFNRLTTVRRRAGEGHGTYTVTVGFDNIPDVREVDALIERTFQVPD